MAIQSVSLLKYADGITLSASTSDQVLVTKGYVTSQINGVTASVTVDNFTIKRGDNGLYVDAVTTATADKIVKLNEYGFVNPVQLPTFEYSGPITVTLGTDSTTHRPKYTISLTRERITEVYVVDTYATDKSGSSTDLTAGSGRANVFSIDGAPDTIQAGDVVIEQPTGGTAKAFIYVGATVATSNNKATTIEKKANWVELTLNPSAYALANDYATAVASNATASAKQSGAGLAVFDNSIFTVTGATGFVTISEKFAPYDLSATVTTHTGNSTIHLPDTMGSAGQLLKVKADTSGYEWFTPSYLTSHQSLANYVTKSTYAQTATAADTSKIGLSSFNSVSFSVGTSGFVSLNPAGASSNNLGGVYVDNSTIGVDSGGKISVIGDYAAASHGNHVPSYDTTDKTKVLTVNSAGNGFGWASIPSVSLANGTSAGTIKQASEKPTIQISSGVPSVNIDELTIKSDTTSGALYVDTSALTKTAAVTNSGTTTYTQGIASFSKDTFSVSDGFVTAKGTYRGEYVSGTAYKANDLVTLKINIGNETTPNYRYYLIKANTDTSSEPSITFQNQNVVTTYWSSVIPVATASTLGMVIAGTNTSMSGGKLNVASGTTGQKGVVQLTSSVLASNATGHDSYATTSDAVRSYVDTAVPTAATTAVANILKKFTGEGTVPVENGSEITRVTVSHGLSTKDITVQVYEVTKNSGGTETLRKPVLVDYDITSVSSVDLLFASPRTNAINYRVVIFGAVDA